MKRYIILQGNQLYTRGVLSIEEKNVSASLFGMPGKAKIFLFHATSIDAPFFLGDAANGQTEFCLDHSVSYDSCVVLCKQSVCLYGTCAKAAPPWNTVVKHLLEEKKNASETWQKFTWKRYLADHYPDNAPIVLCIFNHPTTLKKINELSFYYYGTNGNQICVALPCKASETHPFPHLKDCCVYIDGYWTICADKKKLQYYSVS